MTDSQKLWEAWKVSKAYSKRPSEVYGIRDEVAAWCFDRAVWLFGTNVEHDLSQAAAGAKNQAKAMHAQSQILAKYGLGEVKYRDPAGPKSKSPSEGEIVSSDKPGPVTL